MNAFSLTDLSDSFKAVEPELIRFPSLDPVDLSRKVENFIERANQDKEV